LIVRGRDRVLRAFYNVCRHRAGTIAKESGCVKAFSCTYHGWSYGLDGALLGAPEIGRRPRLRQERLRVSCRFAARRGAGSSSSTSTRRRALSRDFWVRCPRSRRARSSRRCASRAGTSMRSRATGRCTSTTTWRGTTSPRPIRV
jgi:phenylpropionate dioxygenase-like ring-hydroxylating dioxygenase large terminal subunit